MRIKVTANGAEHDIGPRQHDDPPVSAAIGAELADLIGAGPGDVVVDQVRETATGAWLTVRVYACATTLDPAAVPGGTCRDCGRPYSPTHDPAAPGPKSRHSFVKVATR